MSRRFADREDAGRALAALLVNRGVPVSRSVPGDPGTSAEAAGTLAIVLGLPRGGVPVAAVVADALGAPLDVLVVRKVGTPGQPEVAMGAIASIADAIVTVRNDGVLRAAGPEALRRFDALTARERVELERRQRRYRTGLPPLEVAGRDVVLVDDGIATGATMRAAVAALAATASGDAAGSGGPASVTVAVPVAPADALAEVTALVDRVACVEVPDPFWAVGQAYVDFTQTTDDEVARLLLSARR
jgi:putative phosphoribosyl transferase